MSAPISQAAVMTILFFILAAYLIGAVPFGFLVAQARGVDVRQHGSGSIGATNVSRVVGKGWGVFTFFLDVLKGFIPTFFFPLWAQGGSDLGVAFGLAAVLGHGFPVYLRLKGGKGVATGAGMLLATAPVAAGAGLLCWIICMALFRYVSLASMLATLAVVMVVWVRGARPVHVQVFLALLAVLIIWLHRPNIRRLLNGTEPRFGKKKERAT